MREDLTISTHQLAKILGLTDRRIQQLAQDELIPRIERDKYYAPDAVQAYMKQKIEQAEERKQNSDPEEQYLIEHARLEKAKREKAEIQISLMKGTVHTAEDVEREMAKMLIAFRAKILALPSKLAPRTAIMTDANKIEELIHKEVFLALQELKDYDPELFKHKTYVEVADENSKNEKSDD